MAVPSAAPPVHGELGPDAFLAHAAPPHPPAWTRSCIFSLRARPQIDFSACLALQEKPVWRLGSQQPPILFFVFLFVFFFFLHSITLLVFHRLFLTEWVTSALLCDHVSLSGFLLGLRQGRPRWFAHHRFWKQVSLLRPSVSNLSSASTPQSEKAFTVSAFARLAAVHTHLLFLPPALTPPFW